MRVPKYRRHEQGGAFVEFKGKRHYLPGKFGSKQSRDAYAGFLISNVGAVETPQPVQHAGLSLAHLLLAYLAHAKAHYPSGNRSEYRNCVYALTPLIKHCGEIQAAEFGPKRLKAWQGELIGRKKSRDYINQCVSKIRRAFRWAASEELIPVTAFQSLATVPGLQSGRTEAIEHPPRQPVAWSHLEPVLAEVSPTVRAMLLVQWYTGVRSQSVCAATPSQFTKEGDMWLWRPLHKMRHRRTLVIPIGPKCEAVIAAMLAGESDAPLFDPRARRRNKRYREFYSPTTYRQAVIRGIERVNATRKDDEKMPEWTPHQLRHSKGRDIRERYGIEAAQSILGHESLDATEIYSERRLELAKRIAREVG